MAVRMLVYIRGSWPYTLAVDNSFTLRDGVAGLDGSISAQQVHPRTVQELSVMLVQEWDNVPQRTSWNLTASMRRHCQAVIDWRGSHPRYKTKNKLFYHLLIKFYNFPIH